MNISAPSVSKQPYRSEFDAAGERLIIPIRLGWKKVLWGFVASAFVISKDLLHIREDSGWFRYALLALFVAAAIGAIFSLIASLLAEEFVEIGHGELKLGWRMLGYRRSKSYPTAEVFGLGLALENYTNPRERKDESISVWRDFGKRGAAKFDYKDKSIYFGVTLNEDEAAQVVDWMARRLPRQATA